ncbi:hypothetical protein [Phytohalomonas tamaricis]|uniref:hypothetical protein n=1 Tax=Phytohalomonas tamaricis TaxID=2081032 RepID=UPI001319FE42|nr:hypothetical protein [Phytohalomonas tamaricis]
MIIDVHSSLFSHFRSHRSSRLLAWTLVGLMTVGLISFSPRLEAAMLTASIHDESTQSALHDAVVELFPLKTDTSKKTSSITMTATMAQQNMRFVPHVLAIAVGDVVNFPNADTTRHQVYSLSEAKVFTTRLYVGEPQAPISFDKPGIVALGCNIHDQMQAFILVSDAPYFAQADANGSARFIDLPDGPYRVTVWHPRLSTNQNYRWEKQINLHDAQTLDVALALTMPKRVMPSESALQRRFREATAH